MNFNLDLYNNAVNILGVEHQTMIAMEECAELCQAISKCFRYVDREYKKNLTEEIADVLIMIEQLKIIYNISEDDIINWINNKELRLNRVIEGLESEIGCDG